MTAVGVGAALLLILLGAAPGASASWYMSGGGMNGPRDYRETSLEAGVTGRSKGKYSSVKKTWAYASRTEYGLRTSTETTVSWALGGGLEYKSGLGLNVAFSMTPPPKPLKDGSYRSRGVDLGLTGRCGGVIPGLKKPWPSFLDSSLRLSVGWTSHEEYFTTAQPQRAVNQWFPIEQTSAGAGLTEFIAGNTWIGGDVRAYAYDHDLKDLSRNLAFLSLSSLGAANAYDLVLGFPRRSWGLRAGQSLWSWGDIALSGRRTYYVIGQVLRSDTASASLGLYLWRGFGVRGRYDVSRPQGGKSSKYTGVSLEAGF